MDGLQVSIACLLLKVTFEPSSAGLLQDAGRCPTCPEGYFVVQNCSWSPERGVGVRCKPCSVCSAADQETLVSCSTFADSVCGNRTTATVTPTDTPAEAPGEPVSIPETWIVLSVILVSVFLILLFSLCLTLLSCHNQRDNKHHGLDPL